MTRPSVQRRKSPTLPRTKNLGSHDRTQERRPSDTTRKNLCPHPRRKEGPQKVHQRTPQEGVHSTLKKPLHHPLLLHQKERWQTSTRPRLPMPQQTHHMQLLPTTTYPRAHSLSPRRCLVLKIRRTMGIQQHPHQETGPMEGSVHH
jgi:hypothetical protein